MKKILLFIGLIFITACNTLKQDRLKVTKISNRHPEVIAEICKTSFNSSDSIHESIVYLPGVTKYIDNFAEVDCDSVVKYVKDVKFYKVKCPPSITIRDTILKDKFVKEIDKPSIFLLEKSKDSLQLATLQAQQETKITQAKVGVRNKAIVILSSILGLILIWTVLKGYIKNSIKL